MDIKEFYILKVKISAISIADACSFIEERVSKKQSSYICVCPVNTIMECRMDQDVFRSVNGADLVTPDGMPVVWIGRLRGYKQIRRVYGPELMDTVCRISGNKGYRHYLYGSSVEVLEKLKESLIKKYPDLIISGSYSPPFRKLSNDEDCKIVEDINKTNSDILWVGLGSPKQDLWMFEHKGKINVPVMIGVGAAFDFLAGVKPQAPAWIRNSGFEWLFRLASEPKRLWRRYLVNCSLFIWYIFIEMIQDLILPTKKSK